MLSSSLTIKQSIQPCTCTGVSLNTQYPAPALNWDPQASPESFQEQPAPTMNSRLYFHSHRGGHLLLPVHLQRYPENQDWQQSGGHWYCCLCCPQPSHTASHIFLSFGSDWQTPELWKGRKSLGEAQRYFHCRLWPPIPIIYIRIRMLLHREKKPKIYRVLKGTVFLLLSAACPQSGSLFNGLLAPSCLLIGRISYRKGTGKESKLEGSTALQPTEPSVCIQPVW